jgi:hypothetical protein
MSLHAWLAYNERVPARWQPDPADTIEAPEIMVTEEPLTEDARRRFQAVEERKPLELLP